MNPLFRIAARHLDAVRRRGHLRPRGRDADDFVSVHVTTLEAMLREAYDEGEADAKRRQPWLRP